MNAPTAVHLLSAMGRLGATRRLRRTGAAQRAARAWVLRSALAGASAAPNDVTVLIGVRNRSDHRLTNALSSIRAQTHPSELVRAMVIDYGSNEPHAARTADICDTFDADLLRVDTTGPWSRARCLNIGIRRATSTFLLTSDVDVVFSAHYLADAVATLREFPASVVGAPMLDLPQHSQAAFQRAAASGYGIDLDAWRGRASRRFDADFHPSLGMTYAAFYRLVRGYDEYFEVWGGEDRDLMARFADLGLSPRTLDTGSYYLHQWHPKFEGVAANENAPIMKRNRTYIQINHTILRNDEHWGSWNATEGAPSQSRTRDAGRPM